MLHRLFVSFGENTGHLIKDTVNQWKTNVETQRINPWFKRAAYILALNSTVDIQKSFWRVKENMNTSGVALSAVKIVKLKKMFNNIRKAYELVIAKSFWSIYHGKKGADNSSVISKGRTQPPAIAPAPREEPRVIQQVVQAPQVNTQEIDKKLKIALTKVQRSTLRSIVIKQTQKVREAESQAIQTWAFNALPERRIELGYKALDDVPTYNARFISQIGAIEVLNNVFTRLRDKNISSAFKDLNNHKYNRKIEELHETFFNEKLSLLNRNNHLLHEADSLRADINILNNELEERDKTLSQANETVTVLTLRINYMITHKFVDILEKVFDEVNYRHLNDALDGMIARANEESFD